MAQYAFQGGILGQPPKTVTQKIRFHIDPIAGTWTGHVEGASGEWFTHRRYDRLYPTRWAGKASPAFRAALDKVRFFPDKEHE